MPLIIKYKNQTYKRNNPPPYTIKSKYNPTEKRVNRKYQSRYIKTPNKTFFKTKTKGR
jgi:hypothetical protein